MIRKEKLRGKNPHAPVALPVNEPGILTDFLRDNLRERSRNSIKSLLARGVVPVEGRVAARRDYPLRAGQFVQVRWMPRTPAAGSRTLEILYEDGEFLVINKPADLLSIASEKEKERTAYHQTTERARQSDPDARTFIVYRSDRDTPGALLAARTVETKYALQGQWGTLVKTRAYTVVVEGYS